MRKFEGNHLQLLEWKIFQFVEIIFISGVILNLLSYLIRFIYLYRKKQMKTFARTVKEGFSKTILVKNAFSISMILTSLSVFWYMLHIGKDLKTLTIAQALKENIYVTGYILLAATLLTIYSFLVAYYNILRLRELSPTLNFLSYWNFTDQVFHLIGGGVAFKPITDFSISFRKYLIQSKMSELIVSTLLLILFEYIYKILMVVALLYLLKV